MTERVTRLLGMTRDEFFNTYFTGQKELAVMAAMSAPERAQFLSRVLGYERIRAAQDRLKEKRSALRARLRCACEPGCRIWPSSRRPRRRPRSGWRPPAPARLAAATASGAGGARLGEIRPRWEQLQQLREAALALEAELRVADHQATHGRRAGGALERQAAEAAAAREKLEELRAAARAACRHSGGGAALERQAEATPRARAMLAQLEEVRPTWPRWRSAWPGCRRPTLLDAGRRAGQRRSRQPHGRRSGS